MSQQATGDHFSNRVPTSEHKRVKYQVGSNSKASRYFANGSAMLSVGPGSIVHGLEIPSPNHGSSIHNDIPFLNNTGTFGTFKDY